MRIHMQCTMRFAGWALLAVTFAATEGGAFAQTYPNKPIRIVVPFPPGGPADILARIIGQNLAESWGQQPVIDNRAVPALTDLLGGRVSLIFSSMPPALPHVKAGKLKALAVTSAKRSFATPNLPTIAESGLPGYEVINWYGILAPVGTPKEIVARLNAEILKILNIADVKERLSAQGAETFGSTPQEFAAYIRKETEKWAKVVKYSGARLD